MGSHLSAAMLSKVLQHRQHPRISEGKPWETMGNHGKPWETMGNQRSEVIGSISVRGTRSSCIVGTFKSHTILAFPPRCADDCQLMSVVSSPLAQTGSWGNLSPACGRQRLGHLVISYDFPMFCTSRIGQAKPAYLLHTCAVIHRTLAHDNSFSWT